MSSLKGTAKSSISSPAAKRKANKSPISTAKNSKKSKVVARTQSFEPAWWGNVNVLSDDTKSFHSHAAAAVAAAGGDGTPTSTPTQKVDISTSYPPVHTLILGTHPSIPSLNANEMFGNQQNSFWYIAGDALGFRRHEAISSTTGKPFKSFYKHLRYSTDKIIPYSQQVECMTSKGFALWDIIAECERKGSLDTDIKSEEANKIRELVEDNEHMNGLKRIVIANGTTGSKQFVKHFTNWFVDGKLCAASDEMSQRVFKTVMNKAKKTNDNKKYDEDLKNGKLIEVVCLPGVSPAAASISYVEKRDAWEKGCYNPGLADYQKWKDQSMIIVEETPKKGNTKRQVTPTKSKSPRKSPARSPTRPTFRIISSDLATIAPENDWIDLEVPAVELRPSATLTTGQAFNWMVVETELEAITNTKLSPSKSAWGVHNAREWIGPLGNRVISIRETPTTTLFRVLYGQVDEVKEYLHQYFRLETPLAPLYEEWSNQDKRLARIAKAIPGVRILRQDPLECTFSFICSTNNNIPRITKILKEIREKYGNLLLEIPTRQDDNNVRSTLSLYSFPTLANLDKATKDELRGIGLGYRDKFIIETRDILQECGGDDFLLNLRKQQDAQVVQDELIKLSGIGRKVADCIALFSLDSDSSIPVDVHVLQIATRDHDPALLQVKSLTPTVYKRVGDIFRERFVKYPGWAHSLLFVAELPSFREVLPEDIVKEMDEWKEHEKKIKQEKKAEAKKRASATNK